MSPLDRIRWTAAVASARLPATCYRVAAQLALVACDGTGTAWASRQTLANAIRCDEARLKPAFRAMVAAGFIVRGDLAGPCGRQTYRWTLVIPGAEAAPGAESAPRAEVALPGGADFTPNRGRKSPPKGGSKGESKGGSGRASLPRHVPEAMFSSNPGSDSSECVGPVFVLKGGAGWRANKGQLANWANAFPAIDQAQELAKAAAWCASNPRKSKTAKGMPRYVYGWMNRATERQKAKSGPALIEHLPTAAEAFALIDEEPAHV